MGAEEVNHRSKHVGTRSSFCFGILRKGEHGCGYFDQANDLHQNCEV
jgi:hypothetical protein